MIVEIFSDRQSPDPTKPWDEKAWDETAARNRRHETKAGERHQQTFLDGLCRGHFFFSSLKTSSCDSRRRFIFVQRVTREIPRLRAARPTRP